MDDTDLTGVMLARIRKHMIVAVSGLVAGIAVIVVGRLLGGAVFGAEVPGWWRGLSFAVGIATIPVIGFWSTFEFLRCPSCNGLVVFQVNAQASPLARRYSKECRHCGKTIFDDRFSRRFRVVQMAVFFGTILFFGGLALLRMGQ